MSQANQNLKKRTAEFFIALLALVFLNVLGSWIHARWDLTAEKRFTLSPGTKAMLRKLNGTVRVRVFLKGQFPAGFRQLSQTTSEILDEFQQYAGRHLEVRFINPGAGLPDSARQQVYDSLAEHGLQPYNLQVQLEASEGYSEKLIFPGALVDEGDREVAVDLVDSQGGTDALQALNTKEAQMEYKFADAIYRLEQKEKPMVGYMLGNGEPLGPEVYDALINLQKNYRLDTIDLSGDPFIPSQFSAILFLGPTLRFGDSEKLKIDQYVMHGGKVLWFLNEVNASMDSLRDKNSFIAYDKGLNLEDLLFTYGVRIDPDLLQDLQCDVIPLTVGETGGRPQIQLVRWPYFPVLGPASNNPIVKNLDPVLCQFASTIDTIYGAPVRKTILLATSANSRSLGTPSIVSWESVKIAPRAEDFRQQGIPVAVLLEGQFPSLYKNRFDANTIAGINAVFPSPFATQSPDNRMIVASSASLVTNAVTQKDGPLPMGMNQYTRYQFGNREFFLNCLESLTENSDIMATRTKDFRLRLLDRTRVAAQKLQWQILNLALPLALVLFFAMIFQYFRARRYGS